jgi:16S rRNA (cytosine1402-N4)-methyltransferase
MTFDHKTVLLHETVACLGNILGKTIVDCTFGGGGHAELLLEAVGANGKVVGFDRDTNALRHAEVKFKTYLSNGQLILVDKPFSNIKSTLQDMGLFGLVDGIIADIGVSSPQIDDPERGFSFLREGPLDMRMDQRFGQSAADFVNSATEKEIADVIYIFGEEQKSRQIARLIINQRVSSPLKTTTDLANLIQSARLWPGHSKRHPATKTFQALRIFVNGELDELTCLVSDAFDALSVGGVLGIITFHSLEDRIVKNKFKELCGVSGRDAIPKGIPFTESQISAMVDQRAIIVGKFPLEPSQDEIDLNPRARSAKLRAIQKTKK